MNIFCRRPLLFVAVAFGATFALPAGQERGAKEEARLYPRLRQRTSRRLLRQGQEIRRQRPADMRTPNLGLQTHRLGAPVLL